MYITATDPVKLPKQVHSSMWLSWHIVHYSVPQLLTQLSCLNRYRTECHGCWPGYGALLDTQQYAIAADPDKPALSSTQQDTTAADPAKLPYPIHNRKLQLLTRLSCPTRYTTGNYSC